MADRVVIEGNGLNDALGTGRRKSSIARARVRAGKGQISINNRSLNDFFKIEQHVNAVMAPLLATEKPNPLTSSFASKAAESPVRQTPASWLSPAP